jgi:hypothetical protein
MEKVKEIELSSGMQHKPDIEIEDWSVGKGYKGK